MSARQRLKETMELLGVGAKKSMGQNFLISDEVIKKIIAEVQILQPKNLIEIGPGPGALTFFLRQMECPITLIELDRVFANIWVQEGLNLIEDDALQLNWRPLLEDKERPNILVSNLPYQISASIVIDRSLEKDIGLDHMVLMFQKEVAQRIRSACRHENYGILSVIAQTFWKVTTVCDVGPRDFLPPPRIASRVLRFDKKESPVVNRVDFLKFVKMAFSQRRKLLKTNLHSYLQQVKKSEEYLLTWYSENGFKETARAEELTPEKFVQLYLHLREPALGGI